ncbi:MULTISPECIES: hypothetical protein [Mycobacterium avium complex (MAC)]|uniref:hypothetical protein n=1 Tax=Mycobacterium avium complex (MAC) TaxID=120793 RepID=UPI000A02EE58|nr:MULTISPECIES: hypothetical protein [Mycobacterium avium complex (MAC)]UCN12884.1 hypothetical protein LFT50_28725 [Mycobacterium intracellulare subsp. chimaera]
MSPTDPAQLAADIAAVNEAFASIGTEGAFYGPGADSLRAALAGHGDRLGAITSAVQAVAAAAEQRKALVAERDAAMPTEQEIQEAEEHLVAAVAAASDAAASGDANVAAAANADVQRATDRLADLLAQKKAAQERFDQGEKVSAGNLDTATADLPDAGSGGVDPKAALAPLGALLSNLQALNPASTAAAPAGQPMAAEDGAYPQGEEDPAAALLDSLLPGENDDSSDWPDGQPQSTPYGDPSMEPGAGQTHTSADLPQQMPTMSGVVTSADVSGRSANPFLAATPPAATTPAGGAGMMPPIMPMGGVGGPGVASGRDKADAHIMKKDPDLTGEDIDASIATSGIIGRSGKRR